MQRSNVPFAALNQLLNQGYSGYILRWLALDDTLVKAAMYLFLDERAIQVEAIPEEKNNVDNKKYCSSLTTYIQTRVWPKGTAIPFKSEIMLKRAYGISGCFDGVETVVTRVWSLLLASLLANDLYYYYAYPDVRYGTTLNQIFFTQSDNEELSLTASLTRSTVWPELLVVPVAWGLVKALRMSCYQTTALDDKTVQTLHDRLQHYQPSFSDDVLLWLLPVNRMGDTLDNIQRALLWDNRLSAQQRDVLYASLQSLSRRANKVTQWYVLETLSAIADGVALTDFKRLAQADVAPDILLSLLHSKTQALTELQYQARHYKYSTSHEASWYAHYLKPLARYLLAHYLLWCLGQPESKALQPLFWSFKAAKAYIKIKLIYTVYLGIKQLIDRYLAQKHCEEQGKLWLYMNQVADYVCSVCGDLPVFYGNIFNAKNCLDDLLSQPQPLENIVTLLNRLRPSDNITALDFSKQLYSEEKDELASILPIIQTHLPDLQELYLKGKADNNDVIGVASAQHIADFLLHSRLQILDLSSQKIGDNGIYFIVQALPHSALKTLILRNNLIVNSSIIIQVLPQSKLQKLDLGANQIVDVSALTQALPQSSLQTLNLDNNHIVDISPLAQTLPNSTLQSLILYGNYIVDIHSLIQALPQSSLQTLDLNTNRLVNISALAQALPQSKLHTLDLEFNQIVDISPLAQTLPQSSVKKLNLGNNQIADISPLAQALPHSSLQFLYLYNNQIVDVSPLAQALPYSSLQYIDLSYSQIVDISVLAQALPRSTLQHLGLENNQIVNISALIQVLPQSKLQSLDLNFNRIVDISALAQALPQSQLQSLDLSLNQIVDISALTQALSQSSLQSLYLNSNQIADINGLAQALLHSSLQSLYLSSNQIVDINALAQALPHSSLQSLYLSDNFLGDVGAKAIANVLTTANINQNHPLWIDSLDPNEKRIIAQAQPNTNLTYLSLSENQINTTGAKALCRILPQTNIPIGNLQLTQNPGIDPNAVDIKTCIISAASSMQPPLPLRFFYQLTQLSLYPLRQTYLHMRNWLANKPIIVIQADEKTTRENKLAKIDHTLLWQLSNRTAEMTQCSPQALTYAATHSPASRSNSLNASNSLLLFLFASVMFYAIYRLLQTTTQSVLALLSGVDEKNMSPLASNKLVISSKLNFITGWWQNKSTSTTLRGESFAKACKQLMRGLISVDHTLKNLDKRYQQLSDEGRANVERIRFYWIEHAEIVEALQATDKITKKEMIELRAAISELQTEAERLLENDITPALADLSPLPPAGEGTNCKKVIKNITF